MSLPEPVILYCPVEGSNSTVPLSAGAPTSSELVKLPNFPLSATAGTASRIASSSPRIARLYPNKLGDRSPRVRGIISAQSLKRLERLECPVLHETRVPPVAREIGFHRAPQLQD